MLSGNRLRKAAVAAALAVSLGACTGENHMVATATDTNLALEDSTNKMLLLNIIRASEQKPMYFTGLAEIQVTDTAKAGADFTIPFGQASTPSYTFSPNFSVTAQPGFKVHTLDNKEFLTAIHTPVTMKTFEFFRSLGWPEPVLLYLLVDRISGDCASQNTTYSLAELESRYPNSDGWKDSRNQKLLQLLRFKAFVDGPRVGDSGDDVDCLVIPYTEESRPERKVESRIPELKVYEKWPRADVKLDTENRDKRTEVIGPVLGKSAVEHEEFLAQMLKLKEEGFALADACEVKKKWDNQQNRKLKDKERKIVDKEGILNVVDVKADCEGETKVQRYVIVENTADKILKRGIKQIKKTDQYSAKKEDQDEGELVLRSPQGVLYFLGQNARAYLNDDERNPEGATVVFDRNVPLFIVRKGGARADSAITVNYEGDTYSVPADENSLSMMSLNLVSQLIALQKDAKSIPKSSTINIISTGN